MKIIYFMIREETLLYIQKDSTLQKAEYLSITEEGLVFGANKMDNVDIVLIGEEAGNPIQLTQQVFAYDLHVSILIINDSQNFQKIKQALLFTPFIGPTVHCVSNVAGKGLAAVVINHIQRTGQRRSYRKLQGTIAGVSLPPSQKIDRVKDYYINKALEEAPVGFFLINKNGTVLSSNRYAATLLNKTEREILGTSLTALFPGYLGEDLMHFIEQTENKNPKKTAEFQTGGRSRYLEITVSNIEKEDPSYKVVLIDEITDQVLAQKTIEEGAQKVKIIVESMPEMAWTALPNGNIDFFNKRWYEYTGQNPEVKSGWEKAVHPEDLTKVLSNWKKALRKGTPYQLECRYLKIVDQNYRWHLTRALPVKNQKGEILHWVGTCTDIQVLKNTEKKLKNTAEELFSKNGELTASNENLYENNERLAKVNADMDNFIYTASHDLKLPISNIEGLVRILAERLKPEEREDSQIKNIFEMINASVSRFQRTISDLTEIVKLQRLSELKSEPIDVCSVIQDVELDFFQLIKDSGTELDIRVKSGSEVIFSRKNLKSIIYNLLSNAIKYRSDERRPRVIIDFYEEGKYFVFSVKDNGLGMDLEDRGKIFEMFRRMHSLV